MKKINELMEPVKNIGKVFGGSTGTCTDEPLIFIPRNQSHIEICGHKIYEDDEFNVNSIRRYCEENEEIKVRYERLRGEKLELINYLIEKLEEAKLMATYEDGVRYPSFQEMIYENILDRVYSQK